MGACKTTVLGEAWANLALRPIAHAAIDVDALGLAHLPSRASNDGVMHSNLRSVCKNYAALGVQRFVLARDGRWASRSLSRHYSNHGYSRLPCRRQDRAMQQRISA